MRFHTRRYNNPLQTIAIVVMVLVWVWFFLGCASTAPDDRLAVLRQEEIIQLKGIITIQDSTIAAQKHSIDMLEGLIIEQGKTAEHATKVLLQCATLADNVTTRTR